ncbi:ATP-grasp ribosomal peptide maturase [Carbonactinospora thermoautotrophica]|uniref:ATP-grasp ribosomal peptide maturase n=1 Tax=Carbonactinospora thermoautotrophica TaxID=1469144 RepID=UPI000831C782|nr:ATP-grasp ribosomal peptide maturase [Carbonactinospora thermoautotrophica]
MVVLTRIADPTADMVIRELTARGVPVVRFDPADFPMTVRLTARVGDGTGITGRLLAGNREVDLGSVRAVYYRRPSPFTFITLRPEDRPWAIAQARYGLGGVLMALPGARYVNHPDAVAAAEPKPVQLATAHDAGLRVPPTIITDSVDDVRAFVAEVGPIVYKPLYHAPYQVGGQPAAVWTTEVDPSQLDATIRQTAHLFQAKVNKTADVRVTVVGDRVFAAIVRDAELDWRTRQDQLDWQPVEPPGEVAKAMLDYLDRFGLAFGCFDFAVDRDGGWWFLECNPNGQWGFIQKATGAPIAAAFADLLATGRA